MNTSIKECTIRFERDSMGTITMFRSTGGTWHKEGSNKAHSIAAFMQMLLVTVDEMKAGDRLALGIALDEYNN